VLLAADADRLHLILPSAHLGQAFPDGVVHGVDPDLRVLLHVARRQILDEPVGPLRRGQDRPGLGIQDHAFGALGSAVDSDG
jgi:hypothetical protein